MLRRRSRAALAVLVLLGCSACGSASPGGKDGPVLTSADEKSQGGMDARVTGTLSLDGDCLRLDGTPVIWPHGTHWQAEPPAVVLPNGDIVPIGGAVTGGGGYPYVDDFGGMPAEVQSALEACAGETREVAFFNVGSDVEVMQTPG